EFGGVPHAEAPLAGRVDEEDSAEGPICLAAEIRLALLVDEHDPASRREQLARRDESGEPAADDDGVRVHRALSSATPSSRMPLSVSRAYPSEGSPPEGSPPHWG